MTNQSRHVSKEREREEFVGKTSTGGSSLPAFVEGDSRFPASSLVIHYTPSSEKEREEYQDNRHVVFSRAFRLF